MTNTTTKLEAIEAAYNEMTLSNNIITDDQGSTWYLKDEDVATKFNNNEELFVEYVEAIKLDDDNYPEFLVADVVANPENYGEELIQHFYEKMINKKFDSTLLINNVFTNMRDVYDQNNDEYAIEAAKERNNIA